MNDPARKDLCYETMSDVVKNAANDIGDHLWSLYWLVRHVAIIKRNPVIVDIGVANGDSTRAILCACNDVEHRLTSIDYEDCRMSMINMTHKFRLEIPSNHRWRFIHEDSVKAAENWKGSPVDFLFLDTCHTYPETLYELDAWHNNMAEDGIIAGHDFGLPDAPRDGVEQSVLEFQRDRKGRYFLEGHKNCCGLFILWPRRIVEQ